MLEHDGGEVGTVFAGRNVVVAEIMSDFVVDDHLAIGEEGEAKGVVAVGAEAPAVVVDEDEGADAATEEFGATGAGGFDGATTGEDDMELSAGGDFFEGDVGAAPAAGVAESFCYDTAEFGDVALDGAAGGDGVGDGAFGG